MPELKPCPFCGGEAEIAMNLEYGLVDISCENMGCRGWACCLNYKSEKEAREAWNRRVEDGK